MPSGCSPAPTRQLHDRRLLAVLGRPPVGRGLPGTVHHDPRRVHLRAARSGAEKIALRVIYFDTILYSVGGVVGTMHHLYFSGDTSGAHGPWGIFLRGGSHPAYVPDGGGVDVPASGSPATGRRSGAHSHTDGRSCSWSRSGSGTFSGPACSASWSTSRWWPTTRSARRSRPITPTPRSSGCT